MKYKYDLQLHSDLSDGDYNIEEVIQLSKKEGLKAISITDHNTWVNFNKKIKLAKKYQIENITGIEISTKFSEVEVHILGYAEKFNISILKKGLQKTIQGYNDRAALVVKKLKKANIIDIDFKKIKKGKNLAITKYDIAKTIAPLMKISVRRAMKFINNGGIAFVPYGSWAMSPITAIKLIHRADGIAVLAHPGETYNKLIKKLGLATGKKKFNQLITSLIKNKINGIEAYSPKNDPIIEKLCLKLSRDNNLIITGGSDWHGEKHHPELKMGAGGLNQKLYQNFFHLLKKEG